jgi:hypothetical protein
LAPNCMVMLAVEITAMSCGGEGGKTPEYTGFCG